MAASYKLGQGSLLIHVSADLAHAHHLESIDRSRHVLRAHLLQLIQEILLLEDDSLAANLLDHHDHLQVGVNQLLGHFCEQIDCEVI